MNPKLLSCTGLFCALAITIGVWFAVPQVTYYPHGIFLPAKKYKPNHDLPSDTVFLISRYPLAYQKLGQIHVEQHFSGVHAKQIQAQSIQFAKQLAASHGATALVISQAFFDQPTGVEAGLGNFTLMGTAIKVSQVGF